MDTVVCTRVHTGARVRCQIHRAGGWKLWWGSCGPHAVRHKLGHQLWAVCGRSRQAVCGRRQTALRETRKHSLRTANDCAHECSPLKHARACPSSSAMRAKRTHRRACTPQRAPHRTRRRRARARRSAVCARCTAARAQAAVPRRRAPGAAGGTPRCAGCAGSRVVSAVGRGARVR